MKNTNILDKRKIAEAANIIKNDGLVAFPTETVYGLGANALSDEACSNIFRIKERPINNPLIVHVASVEQAMEIAEFNEDAIKLTKFWAGPLTLVLPQKISKIHISKLVTAGLNTIAIRIPAHPVALKLLALSVCPIAAPSANKSGMLSSTTAHHVRQNFGDAVFTLDSNQKTTYGLESTIIDLSSNEPVVLRLGFITPDILSHFLKKEVKIALKTSKIKAPGMLLKHYAPKSSLRLNATALAQTEVGLNFGDSKLTSEGSINLSLRGELTEAAANLYEYLHILDDYAQANNLSIAVAPIQEEGVGFAINDRLKRAAE